MELIKSLFLLTVLLFSFNVDIFAQEEETVHNRGFGLSFSALWVNHELGVKDFLASDQCDEDWDCYSRGFEMAFLKPLKNRFTTLAVPFRIGAVDYLSRGANDVDLMYGLGANFQFGVPTQRQNFPIMPFAWTGLNLELSDDRKGYLYAPIGAGLNIKIGPQMFLQGKGSVNLSYDGKLNHHSLEAGLIGNFGYNKSNQDPKSVFIEEELGEGSNLKDGVKADADADGVADVDDECPNEPGLAIFDGCPDTDNDGIIDKKDNCPKVSGPIGNGGCPKDLSTLNDTDGDGLTDNNDNCPNMAGPASNMGCPIADQDGDGIADNEDKCPGSPGLVRFNGCPDTDGDGVADNLDSCPDKAGLARFSGCPDTDGDGISDVSDKCPTIAGTAANNGCPGNNTSSNTGNNTSSSSTSSSGVILTKAEEATLANAMRTVEFETAKAALRSKSYRVMDEIAQIMKKYPQYNLTISGHTDSVGSSSENQELSETRAKSCKVYLVNKGIPSSRISTYGYGEKQPIADNKYSAGRKKNRRVEFRLSY